MLIGIKNRFRLPQLFQCQKIDTYVDFIKIYVSAELCTESPVSFKQISVSIQLKECSLDARRQKALLEFIKHCPAHNTLKGNPQVEFKLLC